MDGCDEIAMYTVAQNDSMALGAVMAIEAAGLTGEIQLVDGNSNFSASGTETINISTSATTCYIVLNLMIF